MLVEQQLPRTSRTISVALGLFLVTTTAVAAFSISQALKERDAANAAMDLQMASLAVSNADVQLAAGLDVSTTQLPASIEELRGDTDLALHGLNQADREEVESLLQEVAWCGILLLDSGDIDHLPHDYERIQELLGRASESSSLDAASAERRASLSVLGAALVLTAVGWLLVRSHYRTEGERATELARARSGQQLESLLNDSPDIIFMLDAAGSVTYQSASSKRLFAGTATRGDIVKLADPDHQDHLLTQLQVSSVEGSSTAYRLTQSDGEVGWFDLRVSDIDSREAHSGQLLIGREITSEIQLREDLRLQAVTDLLTGLPNRRALQPALDQAAADLEHEGEAVAFIALDLDGFKQVNDTLGHVAGDHLLTQVAERLSSANPTGDVVRLGGDEFAIIRSVAGPTEARSLAQQLLAVLDEPYQVEHRTEELRSSIGVAVTNDPEHVSALVSEADIALYEAKRQGGGTEVLFDPAFEAGATRMSQIIRALRAADYDTEFSVVYQPIVDAHTTEPVSLEALLRWTSPTLGSVGPDEFISVAETSGEICAIGKWVLEQVCQQIAAWNEEGIDQNMTVSFNVSPRQLRQDTFVPCVLDTARTWRIAPERLTVELTESAALDQSGDAQRRLSQLRESGVGVSIDDFGSGYSNLGQLLGVPFDVIKIDRSLLIKLTNMREQAGGDATDPCAIMESIVSIASVFDAPVVCEGVETRQQLLSLQASGISHVQGYLTGRPSPPEDLILPRYHVALAVQG